MRCSTLAAALAIAGAEAFLIPPEISVSTVIDGSLPIAIGIANEGQTVDLPCPGCPVSVTDIQGVGRTVDSENELRLNFRIEHNEAGPDHLLLNDLPIYPITVGSEVFTEPLTADQMLVLPDKELVYASTAKLGYSVAAERPPVDGNEMGLVSLHLDIIEVGNAFLSGIPTVKIQVLETASGKLVLCPITVSASEKNAEVESTDGGKECTSMLCKWRAMVANKLATLRGGKPCASRPTAESPNLRPHLGHGDRIRPGHDGTHRFRGHHHHGNHKFLRWVAGHVLVPVFTGIALGFAACTVGMVVGHLAVFIWRVLFRRDLICRGRQAAYLSVEQVEIVDEIEGDDESKGLVMGQEPPPIYTEKTEEH